MAKMITVPNEYRPPKAFRHISLHRVAGQRNKISNAPLRMMFVFDHTFQDDLIAKELFSGTDGERFALLCRLAKEYYGSKYDEREIDWLAIPFNQFKTYGRENDEIRAEANASFSKHAKSIIAQYKPDVVVTFGQLPFESLCPDALQRTKGNFTNYLGTTVKTEVTVEGKSHEFTVVPTVSLNALFGKNLKSGAYLSGYVARNLVTAFDGGLMRYKIPSVHKMVKGKFVPKYKTHFLTKLSDVKKMLVKMFKEDFVSIDTETENLYRVYNKIQTVQMCCDPDNAYIVPIFHEDSPFTPKELREIVELMREFFEFRNKNKVQIFTNAKFDLNVMRTNFGIRYYKAKIWDIAAGEFVLDENMKVLYTVTGKGYYNLGNLAVQYGCFAFYDNPFGKENRAHIAGNPLTEAVLDYCSLDVVVPWLIFKQQLKRAKDIKYDQYRNMVSAMIGDQIHAFSELETTGALCDIDHLFKLKMHDSVINSIITEKEKKILTSKPVQKANAIISAGKSVPKQGLFGSVSLNHFDLSKSEHKQVLFFDVLKLKAVSESKKARKNGKLEGKIDKSFQKKYADNEIVAAYTDLQKAYKIRNAYVNSFVAKYGEDVDFSKTKRMRPTYSYQDVVTGRTSASDPNLQQIPSRGPLSKLIKRLLISSEGTLLIKVDYSAHEVRGWSIISGDKDVAETFNVGTRLRQRYRMIPDPWIAKRIKLEGDVHKINAAYFFGLPIEQITDSVRNAVKTVIFGLIYQQGDEGLATSTGRSVKEISTIKGQFLDRFPVGLKWFDIVKKQAKDNLFVESPVGRRRTLWPIMFESTVKNKSYDKMSYSDRDMKSIISKCYRQSVNSPVQGFGSDLMMLAIRLIGKYKYDYLLEHGEYPFMNLNVSVHDSLTVEVGYEWFWLAIQFIERAMTTGAKELVEKRHGYKVLSTPEIDFEIGYAESTVGKWDFSYESMGKLVRSGLEGQISDLGYKVNVDKVYDQIMNRQYAHMPEWLQKQLWANDIKVHKMGKCPLTKDDWKVIEEYKREKPKNLKLLAKYEAEIKRREEEGRTKEDLVKAKKAEGVR